MGPQLRLAALVSQRAATDQQKLGPFLSQWFAERAHEKESTRLTWGNARRHMLDFFGSDKLLRDITPADGERLDRELRRDDLADATVRKRLGICKQFFRSAIKARLLTENPFQELKTANRGNKKRQHFVTPAETISILDACSSQEWRVLVALARYGGLRVPSEIRELKWDTVNWAEGCFHVHAPKNEHHADEGDRVVPLFPELRAELSALWELAPVGSVYLLPTLRLTGNPLTTLVKIIKRAGLARFPKPFQNMRATRATELEAEFGGHKATEWCGHSEKIAEAHYWMVTGDDVSRAASWKTEVGAYWVQQVAEDGGNGSQPDSAGHEKIPEKPGFASDCDKLQPALIGVEGLEPPTNEL